MTKSNESITHTTNRVQAKEEHFDPYREHNREFLKAIKRWDLVKLKKREAELSHYITQWNSVMDTEGLNAHAANNMAEYCRGRLDPLPKLLKLIQIEIVVRESVQPEWIDLSGTPSADIPNIPHAGDFIQDKYVLSSREEAEAEKGNTIKNRSMNNLADRRDLEALVKRVELLEAPTHIPYVRYNKDGTHEVLNPQQPGSLTHGERDAKLEELLATEKANNDDGFVDAELDLSK